jgi:hypothetical protein
LIIALIAVTVWLDIKATLLVWEDSMSENPQKVAQLIFVWLFPLVGAIVVLAVHLQKEKTLITYKA